MRLLLVTLSASVLVWSSSASAKTSPSRPPITGISNISVYTSDPAATEHFYDFVLGCAKAPDPENAAGQRYYLDSTQFIEVLPLPTGKIPTSLDHVGYITTNARALRAYLAANGESPGKVESGKDGSRWFRVNDPEGNVVEFVQNPAHAPKLPVYNPIGHHMIHVGFSIQSRADEDRFYKTLLGFKPYWFGGGRPGEIDWVAQQVPNGSDWLEYMLPRPGSPATIPARQLGVLNHFSVGVRDMAAAAATLNSSDRLSPRHDGPKVGLDGKWQFNLYDPDGTRVELMEFKNVQPPCCSPFTAPHPSPE